MTCEILRLRYHSTAGLTIFCAGRRIAWCLRCLLEGGGERVERERAQEVATHTALYVSQSFGGAADPVEVGALGHFLEFSLDVGITHQLRRARLKKEQVLKQGMECAQQGIGLFAAISASAVGLGCLEQFGVLAAAECRIQQDQGMGSRRSVAFEVERCGASDSAVAQPRDQSALTG